MKAAGRRKTEVSVLGRNIFANLFGTALITALTIAITPAQIRILGIEAYGIVGFVSTLQIAFAAFDLGLSSTITRELAADHSTDKQDSVSLVRTALSIYYAIAFVVGLILVLLAGPIAENWFNASGLSPKALEHSLQIIALFLALRWPVALYSGVLGGCQRLDTLNIVKSLAAIIRLAGGLAVLIVWRTLESYLWWIALSALIEVALFAMSCKRVYPLMPWVPGFSISSVERVWRFSLGMNLLGVTALVIVQMDRLVVSWQLSLAELGQYNLAYTVASGLALVIGAISSAILPAFAALRKDSNPQVASDQYIKADRLMLSIVGFASFVLMAYGDVILELWVGSKSAESARPLFYLAFGFWCNSLSAIAYNFAVARGYPKRFLQTNLLLIIPYAGLMYLCVNRLGIDGAAISWIVLNLFYIVALVRPVHRDMVGISTVAWLSKVVLPVATAGGFLLLGVRGAAEIAISNMTQATSLLLLLFSSASYGIFVLRFTGFNLLNFHRKQLL